MPDTTDGKANICNMALSHIQAAQTIVALDEEFSKAARTCQTHYGPTRDALLRSYDFGFAKRWDTLGGVMPAPIDSKYRTAVQLPGDCLRVLKVSGLMKKEWTVEHDKRLLTNSKAPFVVQIVFRNDDPHTYDALFIDMFALALAIKIAGPLARKRSIKDDLLRDLTTISAKATLIDAFEQDEDEDDVFVSSYITARVV